MFFFCLVVNHIATTLAGLNSDSEAMFTKVETTVDTVVSSRVAAKSAIHCGAW